MREKEEEEEKKEGREGGKDEGWEKDGREETRRPVLGGTGGKERSGEPPAALRGK